MPSKSIAFCALLLVPCSALPAQDADLLITGARVWTADSTVPGAQALAIRGDRIIAVGTDAEMERYRGAATRVIPARGRFVAPAFIDNHTHFGQAAALIVGVNLLDVSSEAALRRKVVEARDRLPAGAWLVGGEWGAYALTSPFVPHRAMIDAVTPTTPVLLSKWDRSQHLVNARAIALTGLDCSWDGVTCVRGAPTGIITGAAVARVRAAIPVKALSQRLTEARAALASLASFGVGTIHDNTSPEQMEVFQELKRRGELTTRVYARPTLDKWEALRAAGIGHGFGDDWLKIGGLKGFVDGIMGNSSARFYEPYVHSGQLGSWRTMMEPAGNMQRLIFGADSAGHWPQIHAIGDHGIDTLLTMYETVMRANPARERRWRVIHTQVMRGPEVAARMARLGLIAEVQPYHAIDDLRWMEDRIGGRARWAYAFKTLQNAGVLLSFGSDWPGTNASWYPAEPLLGIYAAVTRQTLDGTPAGGWFPEERVDVETALRAYTVNNAWAAGEENLNGRIAPGLLADVVIIDRSPFDVPPADIRNLKVLTTIVGGRVVHDVPPPAVESTTGMVICASDIACDVGAQMLAKGGNAVDAAVATAFAMAVTYPAAGNLGGGGFMLVKSGASVGAFDFRERAPLASTPTMYLDSAGNIDRRLTATGYLAPGVPGTVRGLALAHKAHGRLPWADVVTPAAQLAARGFPLSTTLARSISREVSRNMQPYAASVTAYGKPGGGDWLPGDTLRLPDLARTLEAIAAGGADAFYTGWIADSIAADMRRNGGLITTRDLSEYAAKQRQPVTGTYRGYTVHSMPPPSSGGVALVEMLNMLEGRNLRAHDRWSPRTLHLTTEAMRRAFHDRARHLGDPDFVSVPVGELTSRSYAARMARTIDTTQATNSLAMTPGLVMAADGESEETTHISVADRDGMAVSLTYTLEGGYGSHVVASGTGVLLNNEMGDFNKKPGYTSDQGDIGTPANLIAPGKRMLSSMTPTIVTRNGQLVLATGSPGGRSIINTVFSVVLNVLEYDMDVRDAVVAPRHNHQWLPDVAVFEEGSIPDSTVARLQAMGHEVRVRGGQGDAHSIFFDATRRVFRGANDLRSADSKVALPD
ncbi:MAG: gamma-glutamyltransferase [Gemmatimonadaceae bacterium]